VLTFVSHIGTMIACAPQSKARFTIHGSEAAIRTMGDTPDDEMAPTWRYISESSILPCSVSTRTHYHHGYLLAIPLPFDFCSNDYKSMLMLILMPMSRP
jgi:hypothetical protein